MTDELRRALREKQRALFEVAMSAWHLDRFATAYVYTEAAARALRDTGIDPGPTSILMAELLTHLRRYKEAADLLQPILDSPDEDVAADDPLRARKADLAHRRFLSALDAMGSLEADRGCFQAAERCCRRYIDAAPDSHKGSLENGRGDWV